MQFSLVVILVLLHEFGCSLKDLPNHQLGCFLDVNNDRYTDVVLFYQNIVQTYYQKDQNNWHTYGQPLIIANGTKVVSVICGDFNYDGLLDMFITIQLSDSSLEAKIALQNKKFSDDNQAFSWHATVLSLTSKEILILDGNGDKKLDMIAQSNNATQFWIHDQQRILNKNLKYLNGVEMESLSFIDLNQDCKADLVYIGTDNAVHIKKFDKDIWDMTDDIIQGINLKSNANKLLFFADVNIDGATDIIIPNTDNTLSLYMQTGSTKSSGELCNDVKKDNFEFTTYDLQIPDADQCSFDEDVPNNILIGDFDLDASMDIVAVMKCVNSAQKIICATFDKSNNLVRNNGLSDKLSSKAPIRNIAHFHSGHFPNGMYFALESSSSINFLKYYDLLREKYFLSVCANNGILDSYGTTLPGVTIKAFFHRRDGHSVYLSSGAQYNSKSLQLYFTVFGLGNIDSYIEKLAIGYPMHSNHYITQPGVPPNSQLYLFPDGNSWKIETFLSPYLSPTILGIVIAVVMLLLGGIWLYLEMKEKKSANEEARNLTTNKFFF